MDVSPKCADAGTIENIDNQITPHKKHAFILKIQNNKTGFVCETLARIFVKIFIFA
jgi:hypothetical protein